MAKKSMIQREIKRKCLVNRFSKKRKIVKQKLRDIMLNPNDNMYEETLKLQEKLQKFPRNSSEIRKRNRCWKTGRSRGFYRDFGLSRHVMREMAHEGLIPGLTKSSW